MLRLALVVVPLLALAGCQKENAAFCSRHPGEQGCPDAGATGGPCQSRTDCTDTPSTPVCDTADNGGTCVLCTASEHDACKGVTPVCDNHACVACATDNDCGTDGLCLPTGACAASGSIIHVSAGGVTAGSCGAKDQQPCSLANALGAVNAVRNVVKLDDAGPYTSNSGVSNFNVTTNVTIMAGNAILHRNVDGPILSISDNISATIVGGTIELAHGANGDGIKCGTDSTLSVYGTIIQSNDTLGIDAGGCSTITLSRSQILSNKRGGINILNGKFVIVGNVFASNGDTTGNNNSAVAISTGLDPINRFDFNTITGNMAKTGLNAGLDCKVGPEFVANNNIIWSNTGLAQITGNCSYSYSDIGPLTGAIVSGTGNTKNDPLLTGPGMWHLGAGSPAIRGADPQADLTGIAAKDIEGDTRIPTADMGADQAPR